MDNLALEAGDDAGKVKWMDVSDKLKLYASHVQFIKRVAEKRDAHWVRTLRLAALGNSSQSPCKPKARDGACTEKKTVSQNSYIKRAGQVTWK